jgi:hypothetical protein
MMDVMVGGWVGEWVVVVVVVVEGQTHLLETRRRHGVYLAIPPSRTKES